MRKQILAIAIPSIIANITTPLMSLIDISIVGHMGDASFIAAIALGGSIFSMVYWVFGFLRMGTSGITAQAYGANNREARDAALWRAMTVAMAVGVILVMLQMPLKRGALWFMGADPTVTALAETYYDILIYGAPATMGIYVLNGWFIGMQNSRLTMWLSVIINVVNIVGSLILVYALHFGMAGVAAGTLIAQWVGFLSGCIMVSGYKPKFMRLRALFNRRSLAAYFTLNSDIFLRTLCLVAVTVWFTRAGARQNDTILAVNALLMQLFLLFSYIMDGFAFAGEALAGRYLGSGELDLRIKAVKSIFRFGSAIALIFTVIYAFGGDIILRILSDDPRVAKAAGEFSWWAITVPFTGFSAFIWDGVFIGETRTRLMLLAMAIATATFFAVYYSLFNIMENHALWLAFVSYLLLRGLLQGIFWIRVVGKERKISQH